MIRLLFIIIVVVFFLFFKKDPYSVNEYLINSPPSWSHLFGTDALGRDVLSRLILGVSYSLAIISIALLIALIIGLIVGQASSLLPKWAGDRLMLIVDFFNSLPSIVYILLVASLFQPTLFTLGLIIGCCSWMTIARQMRMILLKEKQQPYIQMAKQIETSAWHRFMNYYVPTIYPVIGVTAIHEAIHIVFAEATISFLGFGLPANMPTLGNLLMDAQNYFLLGAWWNVLFPGLFIGAIILTLLYWKNRLFKGGMSNDSSKKFIVVVRRTKHTAKCDLQHIKGTKNPYNGQKWDW